MAKNENFQKSVFERDNRHNRPYPDRRPNNADNEADRRTSFDPITTLPYNAMFAYPFPGTGFSPTAFPLDAGVYDDIYDDEREEDF